MPRFHLEPPSTRDQAANPNDTSQQRSALAVAQELNCVVAGNPAVNPSHLFWTDALAIATHSLSAEGIREETFEALLRPVSPLALEPMVAHERRAIFAGVVDRVVPPVEAHSL